MKDLFALLLGGDMFSQNQSMGYPKDDDPNWSKTFETQETKTHMIKKETWVSKDGSIKMEKLTTEIKRVVNVDRLKRLLNKAIENEEYEKAAELRDKIKAAEQ
jgi:protein-arginine kinase activator protein McsA